MTINAVYEPYAAAAWLVNRHRTIQGLVGRLDAWTGQDLDEGLEVDLRAIAEAINDSDELGRAWEAYEQRSPAPYAAGDDDAADERLYDQWQAAGPKTGNPRAEAFGPMSGGEKRMLRMLAVLAPSTRVLFNLSATDNVDQGYANDWRQLVAGKG